jgi:hypothetical protein
LGRTGFDDADFWLAGMRYRQVEPLWPKAEDTATEVRGGCAFGLARSRMLGPVRKLTPLVDMMYSTLEIDRVNGVRAVADTQFDAAIPLLKSKLLGGDQPAVLGVCFTGLLALAPAESLPLVIGYLDVSDEALHAEACAALGESAQPDAVNALIAAARKCRSRERLETILQSLGLSRLAAATDFLIERVRADGSEAWTAFQALRPALVHPDMLQRVLDASTDSSNARIVAAAEKLRRGP